MVGIYLVAAIEAKHVVAWALLIFGVVSWSVISYVVFYVINAYGGNYYITDEGVIVEYYFTKKGKKIQWEEVGRICIVEGLLESYIRQH